MAGVPPFQGLGLTTIDDVTNRRVTIQRKAAVIWQIATTTRNAEHDGRGHMMREAIRRAGCSGVHTVRSSRLYLLEGDVPENAVRALACELFASPVIESWQCTSRIDWPQGEAAFAEVHLQPGVMDPVALTALEAELGRPTTSPSEPNQKRSNWPGETT